MKVLQFSATLMEHSILKAVLRFGNKLIQMRRFLYLFVTILIWLNVLIYAFIIEQFIQGNVPLRHLLNEKKRKKLYSCFERDLPSKMQMMGHKIFQHTT